MRRVFPLFGALFAVGRSTPSLPGVPSESAPTQRVDRFVPGVDHHQHLFGPALRAMLAERGAELPPIVARDVVAHLDSAGVNRALVLSAAYMYAKPGRPVEDEYAKVRAENDWTAAQVAAYPNRLRAFCAVNPLSDYSLGGTDARRLIAT